jgi:hypothetical protein
VRCGVQYAATVRPPARCAICEDEREAVYWKGQRWTTLATLDTYSHMLPGMGSEAATAMEDALSGDH